MSSQPKTATTVRAGAKIDGVSLVPAIVGKGTGVKGVIRGDGGAGDYVITLFDAYAVAIGACAPNAIVQDTGAVPNTGVSTAITQNSATGVRGDRAVRKDRHPGRHQLLVHGGPDRGDDGRSMTEALDGR